MITLKDERTAYRPQLLPGGGSVLFPSDSQHIGWDANNADRHPVTDVGRAHSPAPEQRWSIRGAGHLVYVVGSTLFAIAFDLEQRRSPGIPAGD